MENTYTLTLMLLIERDAMQYQIKPIYFFLISGLLSKPIKRRESSAIRKAKLYYRSCVCVGKTFRYGDGL